MKHTVLQELSEGKARHAHDSLVRTARYAIDDVANDQKVDSDYRHDSLLELKRKIDSYLSPFSEITSIHVSLPDEVEDYDMIELGAFFHGLRDGANPKMSLSPLWINQRLSNVD